MGTTLEGKQINQTYQGLLKTTDNNEVGSSAKEITDGKGNGTGVTLDNSGNIVATGDVVANSFTGDGSQITNVPYPVTSVNTQTGDVVLDTDDISEGSNEYYTDAKVEANSAVAANTAKNSYPSADASKLSGIEDGAQVNVQSDWNTTSGDALILNKPLIPSSTGDLSDVSNTTPENNQVLVYNSTQEEYQPTTLSITNPVTSVNTQTGDVVLDTDDIAEGSNEYYTDAKVEANSAVAANTAKVGITTQQAADIVTNNAKVGITAQQASDITTNNAKISYPSVDATKVGHISVTQAVDLDTIESDVATNNAKISFDSTSSTKLGTIEEGAEVNVNADWNATSGDAEILNKPTLFDGAFSSLTGTPTTIAGYGITDALELGTTSTTALAGDTTTITAQQISDISTNNAKISFDSTSSAKLASIEEGAEVNVNADWNATSGDAEILNKPTLATVATTGAYSDLSGTPSLATVATSGSYNDLSDQPTIPTNNNQLTNGAGYINEAAQTIHTNAIGNAIDFSARVTLDGGVAEGTSGIIKNLQNIL